MHTRQNSSMLNYAKNKITYQHAAFIAHIEQRMESKAEMLTHNALWSDIRKAAKTNPGLQNILDQAIMYYELSKEK